MELSPILTEAGFTAEKIGLRYVKGWPEKSPNPYRLYRAGKFVASFPTLIALVRNAKKRIGA